MVDTASMMVTTGKAMVVAALPSTPTPWPMKIWSTMLYTELTSMEITDGTEKASSSLPTGS